MPRRALSFRSVSLDGQQLALIGSGTLRLDAHFKADVPVVKSWSVQFVVDGKHHQFHQPRPTKRRIEGETEDGQRFAADVWIINVDVGSGSTYIEGNGEGAIEGLKLAGG